MKQQNNKGFSLVELMIVIAIIAILAAIAIPMYGSYTRDANLSSAQSAASQARSLALSEDPTAGNFDGAEVTNRIGALTNDTVTDIRGSASNAIEVDVDASKLPGDSTGTCTITYTANADSWNASTSGDCDQPVIDAMKGDLTSS